MVKVVWVMASLNERGKAPPRTFMPLMSKPRKRNSVRPVSRMVSQKPVKSNVVFTVSKDAWRNYGSVKMTELEEGVMAFDFDSDADRDGYWICPPGQSTVTVSTLSYGPRIRAWMRWSSERYRCGRRFTVLVQKC